MLHTPHSDGTASGTHGRLSVDRMTRNTGDVRSMLSNRPILSADSGVLKVPTVLEAVVERSLERFLQEPSVKRTPDGDILEWIFYSIPRKSLLGSKINSRILIPPIKPHSSLTFSMAVCPVYSWSARTHRD